MSRYEQLTDHLATCEACPGSEALKPDTESHQLCEEGIILREAWKRATATNSRATEERMRTARLGLLRQIRFVAHVRGGRDPDPRILERAIREALDDHGFTVERVQVSTQELPERMSRRG